MKINIKAIQIIFFIACIITIITSKALPKYVNDEQCNIKNKLCVEKIRIILDPGHGGVDPGAVGHYKDNENVINLSIAQNLMLFLEGTGFEVVMTRYNEEGLYTEKSNTYREKKNEDLRNRVNIINNSGADICISIHLNYFSQSKYYGAQTFYKRNCESSETAAKTIQKELKSILDKNNHRVPMVKNDIIIMKNAKIPIVLVECGFLSNPTEEILLNSELYQEKIAWAIFAGLLKYFNEEKRKEIKDEPFTESLYNAPSTNYYSRNWEWRRM